MKNNSKKNCKFCYPILKTDFYYLDFSEEENCWYLAHKFLPGTIKIEYCPVCGRKLPLKK